MKKIISVLFLFCSIVCAYSQEKTALQVVNLALKEDSPNDAVILIQNEIKNITVLAEKRSLFAFLGSLQETLSMFDDARQSYATAAGIGAKDAEGAAHPDRSPGQLHRPPGRSRREAGAGCG